MNAYELADKLDTKGSSFLEVEAANMLRQQADNIHELQNLVIWMSGCGYDFKQHSYFNDCMDSLVLRKALIQRNNNE